VCVCICVCVCVSVCVCVCVCMERVLCFFPAVGASHFGMMCLFHLYSYCTNSYIFIPVSALILYVHILFLDLILSYCHISTKLQ